MTSLCEHPGVHDTAGYRRAVFLDKDGTLIPDIPFNVHPATVRLSRGAGAALRQLHQRGYALIVVSNQSGVAHARFPESALGPVGDRLRELVGEAGAPLTGIYYCPHHHAALDAAYRRCCRCRKPHAGMLCTSAGLHRIDLTRSWMVGDILDDVEAGRRAGCRTVLIDNGNETEWLLSAMRRPHQVAADLEDAARAILTEDRA